MISRLPTFVRLIVAWMVRHWCLLLSIHFRLRFFLLYLLIQPRSPLPNLRSFSLLCPRRRSLGFSTIPTRCFRISIRAILPTPLIQKFIGRLRRYIVSWDVRNSGITNTFSKSAGMGSGWTVVNVPCLLALMPLSQRQNEVNPSIGQITVTSTPSTWTLLSVIVFLWGVIVLPAS